MSPGFEEAVAWLRSLGPSRIEPGHARISALLSVLGSPHERLRGALVVGTNGKGSTSEYARAALTAAGYRVGTTPSPHVTDETERIQVDGAPISSGAFVVLAERVRAAIEGLALAGIRPTMFEALVAMAYLWFDERAVDLVVVEAGMGGRDDATSVAPFEVKAVTSVALDHTDFLGADIAQIAANKAGAIRSGDRVVVGRLPELARHQVQRRATEVGATEVRDATRWVSVRRHPGGGIDLTLRRPGGNRAGRVLSGIDLPARGAHQLENLAVAFLLVNTLEAALGLEPVSELHWREGLRAVRLPARLEEILISTPTGPRRLIVDGAHNPAALTAVLPALREILAEPPGDVQLVFGAMRDKDCAAMVAMLPRDWPVIFTSTGEPRSADPLSLAALRGGGAVAVPDAAQALDRVFADRGAHTVIVLGSLHLAGVVRQLLAVRPSGGAHPGPATGHWRDRPTPCGASEAQQRR